MQLLFVKNARSVLRSTKNMTKSIALTRYGGTQTQMGVRWIAKYFPLYSNIEQFNAKVFN